MAAEQFGYDKHGSDWEASCTSSQSGQSPIVLPDFPEEAQCDDGVILQLPWRPTLMKAYYTDREIKFSIPKDGRSDVALVLEEGTCGAPPLEEDDKPETKDVWYRLVNFHFHTHSEHTIGKSPTVAEMHIVFADADGKPRAVLGYLLDDSEDIESPLLKMLTHVKASNVTVFIDWQKTEIKQTSLFQIYTGSLTTPDCDEPIRWHVAKTNISRQQAQWLAKLNSTSSKGNYRLTQPLNNRAISSINMEIVAKAGAPRSLSAGLSVVMLICLILSGLM